jgi:hypothetical protein
VPFKVHRFSSHKRFRLPPILFPLPVHRLFNRSQSLACILVVNRRPLHRGHFIVIFAWYCVSPAIALVSNRTIDDGLGDSVTGQKILFLPTTQGVWNNQNCVGCALNPDTTKAFGGTYTAATYNSGLGSISATLNFQGAPILVRLPSSG